ncbi:MAG TPA: PD-(D/E)XK nuclease family protein [Actinomycetota bacterium]|nr:PD-(D/E)XK nuclease family protein [Actinomycetota bacterium]
MSGHQEARLFDEVESLFELNPSRLQTYLDCPRQYRYRYVDHRPERRSFPQTALGRSVHRALRDFYALPPADRTESNLILNLRHAWDPSGYPSGEAARSGLARAEDMLRRFHAMEDHSKVRAIALESKFALSHPGAGIYVWGRVDRLDADGDEYVVVDYKTGTYRLDEASIDGSLPLSLYAMAVSQAFRKRVSRIVLYDLAAGRRVETSRNPARLADDWMEIQSLVARMRGESSWEATPGHLCRYCDFLVCCPEGKAEVGPDAPALMRRTFRR